jgi:hypothetical protein
MKQKIMVQEEKAGLDYPVILIPISEFRCESFFGNEVFVTEPCRMVMKAESVPDSRNSSDSDKSITDVAY